MKEWIISICVITFLIGISSVILPEGKIGKYIKSIFSIVTVLVIISPILKIDLSSFNFNQFFSKDIQIQQEYIDYIDKKMDEEIKKTCSQQLIKQHLNYSKIETSYIEKNDENILCKITIYLNYTSNQVDKEHIIVIEELRSEITKLINIDKNNIEFIYLSEHE